MSALLITIARACPESTFTTIWTDDTCSTEAAHTIPEQPLLPMCENCGDRAAPISCHGCNFPLSARLAFFNIANGFEPPFNAFPLR